MQLSVFSDIIAYVGNPKDTEKKKPVHRNQVCFCILKKSGI